MTNRSPIRYASLPAGDIRMIRPAARLLTRLQPLVTAAAPGGRSRGAAGRLPVALRRPPRSAASGRIKDTTAAEVCALTVAAGPGAARTWSDLRAARPDRLPEQLTGPWCAVRLIASDLLPVAAIACCWAVGVVPMR